MIGFPMVTNCLDQAICRHIYIYIYLHMIKIQYQDNDVGLPIFLIIHYDKGLLHDLISHGHQLLGSSGWIFPSKAISDRNLVDQSIESLEI